jgi:hypothetical protein
MSLERSDCVDNSFRDAFLIPTTGNVNSNLTKRSVFSSSFCYSGFIFSAR